LEVLNQNRDILIIYPHWPPSNLAGVHRPRLISNYIHQFGWRPIIVTVDHKYYEENLDWDLCKTVSDKVEVHYVRAFPVTRPRLIGDIGLRAFWHIYKRCKKIITQQKVDFIWIPIPSFYTAILGRILYEKTKIQYGIDYIDPWLRNLSGRNDWRHLLSNLLAKILEPIAVKKAALITGVSEEYYKPVLQRNFQPNQIEPPIINLEYQINQNPSNKGFKKIRHFAFPYGFDPNDHKVKLNDINYPWDEYEDCKPLVYAGAFLPNSRFFIEILFEVVSHLINVQKWDSRFHLFFLGTGYYPGKTIMSYAKDFGIEYYVHEIHDRFPYLHILNFLSSSYGVMVIGSTEKHYTASKVYQGILSQRPIFSMLHEESTAYDVLKYTDAADYTVGWSEKKKYEKKEFFNKTLLWLDRFLNQGNNWNPNIQRMHDHFSSQNLAKSLSKEINSIL